MLAKAKRSFYQQCSTCAYLKNSNKCTEFFHDLVKRNNKHNTIVVIVKRLGEHTTSLNEVVVKFEDHFQELMGIAVQCKGLTGREFQFGQILNAKQQLDLARDITPEEIRKALLDVGNDSTWTEWIRCKILQSGMGYSWTGSVGCYDRILRLRMTPKEMESYVTGDDS